jgi:hypothetical protein
MDELPDHQTVIALSVLAVRYTDEVELLTGLDLCEAIAWPVHRSTILLSIEK